MPVNFVSETNKGVEKSRFSLSLNKNNATYLINGNTKFENSKENLDLCKASSRDNKENKPVKRPFTSTYLNTLNAAKKLKPLGEAPKHSGIFAEPELEVIRARGPAHVVMLNGHHNSDSQNGSAPRKTPIATLSNLGNTCFLNSVLYTLRYAPRFIHNLHHLVSDLASVEQRLGSLRLKSSSLGRGAAGLAAAGARSASSKDLLALPQADHTGKSKIQIATEKLHETYLNLRAAESKCSASAAPDAAPEPYAADAFLAALREVNSTFEGNRQQDAHELLVCILDNIRETCRALAARAARLQLHENKDTNGINRQPSLEGEGGKTLGNLRKSWKKRKEGKERRPSPPGERPAAPAHRPGFDFVAEQFEGTMVVRTMCVECEAVRVTEQAVCELCVPVLAGEAPGDSDHDLQPFRAACLSTEHLRDQNKYWCEQCLRYNEARRSVTYSRLPRLLVLQLKRFSGGMEKITRHAPTPLLMPCFCEPCVDTELPLHRYILWAVIMHLGQSLTGGHYVAYVRAGAVEGMADSEDGECERDGASDAAPSHTTSSFMRTLFNRPRPQPSGCMASQCCVPRRGEPGGSGWLQCDDELVKPLSNEEFEDLLSPEPKLRSAATPYLLFYVKTDVG